MDKATIDAPEADLDVGDDPTDAPGPFARFLAWALAPLVPLANAAVRYRMEVAAARFTTELTNEKKKRLRAELKASAQEQKAETIALMHAQIVAMLEKEKAFHVTAAQRATER